MWTKPEWMARRAAVPALLGALLAGPAAAQQNAPTGGPQGGKVTAQGAATYGGVSQGRAQAVGVPGVTAAPHDATSGPGNAQQEPSLATPPVEIGSPAPDPRAGGAPADPSGTEMTNQGFVLGLPFAAPGDYVKGIAPPADPRSQRATGEHALPEPVSGGGGK